LPGALEDVMNVGLFVRDLVLGLADILRNPGSPGWVTLLLLLALGAAVIVYLGKSRAQLRAVTWFRDQVRTVSGPADFAERMLDIDTALNADPGRGPGKQVAETWREYKDTLVEHVEEGRTVVRNAVRPSIFFNAEDLGFGPGFARHAPGLFVTVGLSLTFLGLISALGSMNLTGDNATASLNTLLTIASAKFIMSLTGLVCSILFTIVLRWRVGKVEHALRQLCHDLEVRLSYVSLEALAIEQLRAAEEQRDRLRELGYELVAELGRPLREELPQAISASIRGEMGPLIDQVSRMGSAGMGSMVADLSQQFSGDVSRALGAACDRLTEAAAKIGELAGRLDQSSGRMGAEMEQAVTRLGQAIDDLRGSMGATAATAAGALTQGSAQLLAVMNSTLEGIRNNTGEGARAMSAAAAEMREAAAGFRAELESASQNSAAAARETLAASSAQAGAAISDAFDRASAEIAARAGELSARASRELIAPIDAIAERIRGAVSELSAGAVEMRRMSDAVRSGAEAGETAAGTFRAASQALTGAAQPIRETTERIEASVRGLAASTETAAETVVRSAEQTPRSATSTLDAAGATLGAERQAIEAALAGVARMLEAQRGQGDRLDTMDVKLGKAFEDYRTQVQGAIEAVGGHVREMTGEMNSALDTMRSILEQAEEFRPQQARRA
jgi:hypothetical protein